MHELVINLHMHTIYSDGQGTHQEIIQAALCAGLDAVIVTDHNVWVNGLDNYYKDHDRRVLLMVGEEVNDQTSTVDKNHLLVIGAGRELAPLGSDPQHLLDGVAQAGGLSFFAHFIDPPAPAVNMPSYPWLDWDLQRYTGIELWNGMSEYKSLVKTKLHAFYYYYNRRGVARGPYPEALRKWDELLAEGRRVVAIGGSDAHAFRGDFGPLHFKLFPYEFHFRTINTHLLVPHPLTGDVFEDQRMILEALRQGHTFVGYDLPAFTRGFRFTAQGKESTAQMGDEISAQNGVTFQIRLPMRTECNLLRNGKTIKTWTKRENCTYITTRPGVYRVEAYLNDWGKRRGWIFSNPIYVKG